MPDIPSRSASDPSIRDQLAQRVAERRKHLGDLATLDPRVRALSQSSARNLMPPRPAQGRSTLSLALFAILGAVALVACVGTASAVVYGSAWLQGILNDPSTTVQNFYGAVQQGDYARAYTNFGDAAQARTSEAAFVAQFSSYDAIDGSVVSYTLGAPRYTNGGNTVTIAVAVTRRANPRATETDTLALVKQAGQWRIAAILVTTGAPTPVPK